jgi:hypothetical protein
VLRLRGGGGGQEIPYPPQAVSSNSQPQMGIAAGGHIDQAVKRDRGRYRWNASETKVFNVQILNSLHFQHVTGIAPPNSPVSAATYARHGYPFFSMYEEPSTVVGQFSIVKSVGQIDNTSDPSITPRLVDITKRTSSLSVRGKNQYAGFFNPCGPVVVFRSLQELEKAVRAQGQVLF